VAPAESLAELFQKRAGYWIAIESASYESEAARGTELRLMLDWDQMGWGKLYGSYRVGFWLEGPSGWMQVGSDDFPADRWSWGPGRHGTVHALAIPQDIVSGRYRLWIAVLDAQTRLPGVNLANASRRSANEQSYGHYPLGEVAIR
jgi:hypothetical protein